MAATERAAVLVPDPSGRSWLQRIKWLGLDGDDYGEAVRISNWQDRSVQVLGTWDAATLVIQGSNDGGTTWETLHDTAGNNLTFSSNGLKQILELVDLIRPSVSGGGATTSLNVWIQTRGDKP